MASLGVQSCRNTVNCFRIILACKIFAEANSPGRIVGTQIVFVREMIGIRIIVTFPKFF